MYVAARRESLVQTSVAPTRRANSSRQLAATTRRSKSFLAAEAVAAYVARERAIIEGIQRGLADMKAGSTISHDEAMDEIDALIDGIEQAKQA